jgi:hypothetical protein
VKGAAANKSLSNEHFEKEILLTVNTFEHAISPQKALFGLYRECSIFKGILLTMQKDSL